MQSRHHEKQWLGRPGKNKNRYKYRAKERTKYKTRRPMNVYHLGRIINHQTLFFCLLLLSSFWDNDEICQRNSNILSEMVAPWLREQMVDIGLSSYMHHTYDTNTDIRDKTMSHTLTLEYKDNIHTGDYLSMWISVITNMRRNKK